MYWWAALEDEFDPWEKQKVGNKHMGYKWSKWAKTCVSLSGIFDVTCKHITHFDQCFLLASQTLETKQCKKIKEKKKVL